MKRYQLTIITNTRDITVNHLFSERKNVETLAVLFLTIMASACAAEIHELES